MIGLLINLFIIGVALTYFVSSSQTYKIQSIDGRLQENARLALQIISSNLRNSGFCNQADTLCDESPISNIFTGVMVAPGSAGLLPIIATCSDDNVNAGSGSSACLSDIPEVTAPAFIPASDRLALSYADESLTSVCGLPVVSTGGVYHVVTFWAGPGGTNGSSALWCQVTTVDPSNLPPVASERSVPLIDGVETIQFEYGVDIDGDTVVDQYLNGSALQAKVVADLTANPNAINTVRTVKVAILVSSGLTEARDINLEDSEAKTYTVLDYPISFSATDSRSRELKQIFSTTIGLKNF